MQGHDFRYERIAKELTSDNQEQESEELQQMLSENTALKKIYRKLESFWINYFPKKISHNIIEKTEKKLVFTYKIKSNRRIVLWYKITASFF